MLEEIAASSTLTIAPPQPGEYSPYYHRYISLVAGNDILTTLDEQRRRILFEENSVDALPDQPGRRGIVREARHDQDPPLKTARQRAFEEARSALRPQVHIKQHQVDRIVGNDAKGLLDRAATCQDPEVGLALQAERQAVTEQLVVIEKKNASLFHSTPLWFRTPASVSP